MVLRSRWLVAKEEVIAKNGMVSASTPEAAEAGLKMLLRGGNAVDAAVAIGFCNTVLEPYLACLGGLGFMLIYDSGEDRTVALDFNARTPRAATPDMFKIIGEAAAGGTNIFEVEGDENNIGGKSVTVPTACAGFCKAHGLYGSLPLGDVLAPAIHLASDGFILGWDQSLVLSIMMARTRRTPAIADIWYPNGCPLPPGSRVVQPDLGRLLKRIAKEGSKILYEGELAEAIVEEIRRNGGVMASEDLADYEPGVYEPLGTGYRGYDVVTVPTPSGGITVLQALNILENFDLASMGHNSPLYLHTFIEASRHAFADRYRWLGDWEQGGVPLEGLLSKEYAAEIARSIEPDKSGFESSGKEPWVRYLDIAIHDPWRFDSSSRPRESPESATSSAPGETTHFNVVDEERNVVSCTHTPGFSPGIVPQGTGFYLSAGMGWFVPRPGHPNSIAGWKRPLMNMAPLMLLKDGVPVMSQGAPGSRRIINRNTQVVLNVIEFGMGMQEAIAAPTVDASGNDALVDSMIPSDVVERLKAMGHRVKVSEEGPGMSVFARPSGILIEHEKGTLRSGVDPFRRSQALGY